MSGKEGSDGSITPKKTNESISEKKAVAKQKNKKSTKKDETPAESTKDVTPAVENESPKETKPRKKSKFYVEVEDDSVPLLDQPPVVEGSRQRRSIIQLNSKAELSKGAIQIPYGKGTTLGRIPTISSRFKRLRIDEIKHLHRFMFGKLGNINNLNGNILKFNGFTFIKDSPDYAKKLAALGKMQISVLREFLLLFDLDLKIKKKEDVAKAILDFLLCPERTEVTVNPNIVSHPKRKATKRNYYEREIEDVHQKRTKKSKANKAKETDTTQKNGHAPSTKKNSTEEKESGENKTADDESKENNAGADNTNELKKPAKKRKRNQVIEEQPENSENGKSKRTKSKGADNESAINRESPVEVNPTENLTDDELKTFLKNVLKDANLEKTTMKTVFSLITKHYPNYNFSKKKEFIKEYVTVLVQEEAHSK